MPAVMVAGAPGAGRQSAAPSQKSWADTPAAVMTNTQHTLKKVFMTWFPRRRGRRLDAKQTPAARGSNGRDDSRLRAYQI